MRIAECESWIISFPCTPEARDAEDDHVEVIGVNLTTDSGATAMGFTFTDDGGGGRAIKALLDEILIPELIGSKVESPRAVWPRLRGRVHQLGPGITSMALAAIDIGLWDLQSRLNDRSLAAELGQLRARVPAYGSGKASPFHPLDELIRLTMTFVDEGVGAVKLRIGVDPDDDVRRIAAVREAVGPDVRIMVDANERLDLATAIWLGERIKGYDIFWFEEALPRNDISAYRRMRDSMPIPIALGEHLFGFHEFVPFVEAGAVDILQPDACIVGGITEMMRVGELAKAHGLALAPHHISELHIHLAAAIEGAIQVEYFPMFEGLLNYELEVEDGEVLVPERPGHGIEFSARTWESYRIA